MKVILIIGLLIMLGLTACTTEIHSVFQDCQNTCQVVVCGKMFTERNVDCKASFWCSGSMDIYESDGLTTCNLSRAELRNITEMCYEECKSNMVLGNE